jgi:predicted acylesterase/phospholipase RssA
MLGEGPRAVLRVGLNLARVGALRRPDGSDLELGEPLAAFRGWLLDMLQPPMEARGGPDLSRLGEIVPAVRAHARRARSRLLEHFANDLDPAWLDAEVRKKRLVLVLGGGGGSGFAHLGAFALLHDLGWEPDLIVGASMGSLMGLIRAIRRDWDPVGTLLSLPRRFDLASIFAPFRGSVRYGFPGAMALRLRDIARAIFALLLGRAIPRLDELTVPLEVVVTGVGLGMRSAVSHLTPPAALPGQTRSGLHLRRRTTHVFRLLRTLTANPRFLQELVFGRDPLTRRCSAIDAVGFSCAVPGLFCYDLDAAADATTVEIIDTLFERHRLWGLIDGGVINNVPSRVAWDSVRAGTIGSRNAFIYALDPFAPRINGNAAFIPVQRIAHRGVAANLAYADLHKAYSSPPSPIKLALGWSRLRALVERTRSELEVDRPLLRALRTPLPPVERVLAA